MKCQICGVDKEDSEMMIRIGNPEGDCMGVCIPCIPKGDFHVSIGNGPMEEGEILVEAKKIQAVTRKILKKAKWWSYIGLGLFIGACAVIILG